MIFLFFVCTLQKEEYANFSKAAGLLTQNERTQVYGFDKSIAQKAAWKARKAQKPLDNGGGSGIMNTTNAVGNTVQINNGHSNSLTGPPNGIVQRVGKKGGIDRNYYDKNGNQIKQVSNNGHGNKSDEKLGEHGEHAHDYLYNENGELVKRSRSRELNDEERKENADIL